MRQVIRRRKIPFEIASEYVPNEATIQAIHDGQHSTPEKVYYDLNELSDAIDQEC